MGRSVPTYREELNRMITDWNRFRRSLRKRERDSFDEMILSAKKHATAGQYQANPDPMETLMLSILLEHRLMLERIERRLCNERMDIGHIPGSASGEDDDMAEDG